MSDGQQHLHYIVDRKQSNCQSKRSHWITKKTSKRHQTLPWRREKVFQDDIASINSLDKSKDRV